ncbi:MAG: GLUG motif-containing protein, partial [Candidatus Natronoplasma sp.]
MKGKISVFAMSLLLIISTMLAAVGGEVVNKEESVSEGIEENETQDAQEIYDWYDLDEVRSDLNGDYVLMNDLGENTTGYDDLVDTEDGWEPIGEWDSDKDVGFNGTFDGNGHEIRDLYINRTGEYYVALFGGTENRSEITDAGVVDADVSGNWYVGGLVGQNSGTVINSYATGTVTGSENLVGGLVGSNSGTVSDSHATGTVTGSGEYIGGLVGRNGGTVENSYATGDVSGSRSVGGLLGENSGTVSNSYNTGDVSGSRSVGGLLGENSGFVNNSYNTGDVSGSRSVGGLVGWNSGRLDNSHYNIDTVMINGGHHVTIGGLFDEQYQDWIEDKNLDIADYSDTLVPVGDHYEISSVDGLRDLLGFAGDEEYYFRLTGDIDLSNEPGLYIPYLSAEFEGAGHTVSNLYIDMSFAGAIGMFGQVRDGVVTNIGVVDADLSGSSSIGGLVGSNYE